MSTFTTDWREQVRADVSSWPPLTAEQTAMIVRAFGTPLGGAA